MSKDKRVHKFATLGLWKAKTKSFPKLRFSTFGIFTEYNDTIMSHIWPIWMSNWGISLQCVAVHCSWFDSNYHIEAQKTQQSPFYCYMKKIIFFDLFVILPFMVISKVDKQFQQGTKMIICFFSNISQSQYQWKNKRNLLNWLPGSSIGKSLSEGLSVLKGLLNKRVIWKSLTILVSAWLVPNP